MPIQIEYSFTIQRGQPQPDCFLQTMLINKLKLTNDPKRLTTTAIEINPMCLCIIKTLNTIFSDYYNDMWFSELISIMYFHRLWKKYWLLRLYSLGAKCKIGKSCRWVVYPCFLVGRDIIRRKLHVKWDRDIYTCIVYICR